MDTVIRIDRRIHILDPSAAEYLTSDKKNILVNGFVVWSVRDPIRYLVSATDQAGAEARLTDMMRSELGTTLGAHSLSVLISTEPQEQALDDMMQEITQNLARRARDNFGIEVAAVRIKRLKLSGPKQSRGLSSYGSRTPPYRPVVSLRRPKKSRKRSGLKLIVNRRC